MAKYKLIATEIRRFVRERQLKPGDPLPSDRELANLLRVSPHTLRYASDLLCREGLLDRRHGSGTFIKSSPGGAHAPQKKRLGLLYVDMEKPLHPYSQTLTFGLQAAAFKEGYELLVEEMRTDDLVKGKLPEMLRRRSVDAVILDGRIRDFHIHFLRDQNILYVVTGNCPLGNDVPQVRVNMGGLAFEITRELLQSGHRPVWFDVDPAKGELWHVDREVFRGYTRAINQFGGKSASLHLCPIEPDRIANVAETILREGLKNAAVVVSHWASAMLPAALAMHTKSPHDLAIIPIPSHSLTQSLRAPNVVQWSRCVDVEESAQQAVNLLIPVLEGKSDRTGSVTLEMSCKFARSQGRPRMDLSIRWEARDEFEVQRFGAGQGWRHIGAKAGSVSSPDDSDDNSHSSSLDSIDTSTGLTA